MPSPFHHDVRRDAQGQGGDDESATSGVGADEFPLGMDLVSTDIALVGRNADLLIDAGESAEFLDVPVHSLIGIVRQGLIVIERGILVFLQNGLCNVVKFDGYTICRLDRRNFNMVAFNVAFAKIIGV